MPIKRHKALQPLSRDHHNGLILAQTLKKGAPHYKGMPTTIEGKKEYTVLFYSSDLIKHFNDEEQILFPLVKGRSNTVDNQINEIIDEHRKMENLISEIQNIDDFEKILNEFGTLLEKHIRKEERELFNEIEKLLSGNELSEIETKLK
jgi:iron-sulfur cluster repair protein YtfE (RIC family)